LHGSSNGRQRYGIGHGRGPLMGPELADSDLCPSCRRAARPVFA
jgi:hypothetical protein